MGIVSSKERPTEAALAAELDRLGVPFVAAGAGDVLPSPLPAAELVAALAGSREARLRLALIPLFITRYDYARAAPMAAEQVSAQAWVTLTCYYTAALLLQRKHSEHLAQLGFVSNSLPNVFGHYFDLSMADDVDALLAHVAQRQAQMSGRPLNWLGTYEHALNRLVRHMELEAAWAES